MSEKVSESENSIQNIKVKETSINGKRKLLKKKFLLVVGMKVLLLAFPQRILA